MLLFRHKTYIKHTYNVYVTYALDKKGGIFMNLAEQEKMEKRAIIANNLTNIRQSRNLTTTEVADVIGQSRQGYYNYETKQRDISIYNLMKLAEFYGVSVDFLVSNSINENGSISLFYDHLTETVNGIERTQPIELKTFHKDVTLLSKSNGIIEYYIKNQKILFDSKLLFSYADTIYTTSLYDIGNDEIVFKHNGVMKKISKENRSRIIVYGIYGGLMDLDINPTQLY